MQILVIDRSGLIRLQIINNAIHDYCGVLVGLLAQAIKRIIPVDSAALNPCRSGRVA
jgi:hypothetical protein